MKISDIQIKYLLIYKILTFLTCCFSQLAFLFSEMLTVCREYLNLKWFCSYVVFPKENIFFQILLLIFLKISGRDAAPKNEPLL